VNGCGDGLAGAPGIGFPSLSAERPNGTAGPSS